MGFDVGRMEGYREGEADEDGLTLEEGRAERVGTRVWVGSKD